MPHVQDVTAMRAMLAHGVDLHRPLDLANDIRAAKMEVHACERWAGAVIDLHYLHNDKRDVSLIALTVLHDAPFMHWARIVAIAMTQ